MQGNWGELVLDIVKIRFGKGREYEVQQSLLPMKETVFFLML
jgi:hypothetical protein